MSKKRTRGNPIPLIVENHPEDYNGYPFITLLQYNNDHALVIVDNADDKTIKSYVLDLCGPAKIDEEYLVQVAAFWWENNRETYPISFEFSRLGLTAEVSKIYRTFNVEYVTRVIGPLQKFEMKENQQVRRRKRKPVPAGMEVKTKIKPLV